MKLTEVPYFDGQAEGRAFREGMKEAFRMIEHEIDLCTVNNYTFPILHIRDFIDKMLGRKKAERRYVTQRYNDDECRWADDKSFFTRKEAEDWVDFAQRNIGGTWRVKI